MLARTSGAARPPGQGVRKAKVGGEADAPKIPIGRPPRLAHLVAGSDRQLRRERAQQASEAPPESRSGNPTPASGAPPQFGACGDILCLPNPEWLPHALTVIGPSDDLSAFRRAAAGPGMIPWVADYDRLEEDWVNAMVTPPPSERGISVEGARILARQLRERVELEDQRASDATLGVESCPLDLHRLVPVPARLLRVGPDDPAAMVWLWENWGTTWALRGTEEMANDRQASRPEGHGELNYRFWSADWTPWRALAAMRSRWPSIRFQVSVRAVSE